MTGSVEQKVIGQIVVRRVQLDAVEARFLRELRAVTELFDDVRDFVQFKWTRFNEIDFGNRAFLFANGGIFKRTQGRWSDRCHAASVGRTGLTYAIAGGEIAVTSETSSPHSVAHWE